MNYSFNTPLRLRTCKVRRWEKSCITQITDNNAQQVKLGCLAEREWEPWRGTHICRHVLTSNLRQGEVMTDPVTLFQLHNWPLGPPSFIEKDYPGETRNVYFFLISPWTKGLAGREARSTALGRRGSFRAYVDTSISEAAIPLCGPHSFCLQRSALTWRRTISEVALTKSLRMERPLLAGGPAFWRLCATLGKEGLSWDIH